MQRGDFTGLGDTFDYVAEGYGVLFDVAVPMACWMGFKRIYLLGCDATREGHAHAAVMIEGQGAGRQRQDTVQRCALAAYEKITEAGRELWDCSIGGTLPIPKIELKKVLKG